jgi:hypothetical protein
VVPENFRIADVPAKCIHAVVNIIKAHATRVGSMRDSLQVIRCARDFRRLPQLEEHRFSSWRISRATGCRRDLWKASSR